MVTTVQLRNLWFLHSVFQTRGIRIVSMIVMNTPTNFHVSTQLAKLQRWHDYVITENNHFASVIHTSIVAFNLCWLCCIVSSSVFISLLNDAFLLCISLPMQCIAVGSHIANHETESAQLRPYAIQLSRCIAKVRQTLMEHCFSNRTSYPQKVQYQRNKHQLHAIV